MEEYATSRHTYTYTHKQNVLFKISSIIVEQEPAAFEIGKNASLQANDSVISVYKSAECPKAMFMDFDSQQGVVVDLA